MLTSEITGEQWKHLMIISSMHNATCKNCLDISYQEELNEYVLLNEDELAHELILEILLENVEMCPDFLKIHKEYVGAVYRIVKKMDKITDGLQSLRSSIRLNLFLDLMNQQESKKS